MKAEAGLMTSDQIADRLDALADQMICLGVDMQYYAGLNAELSEKGRELYGAGMIAKEWVECIDES